MPKTDLKGDIYSSNSKYAILEKRIARQTSETANIRIIVD